MSQDSDPLPFTKIDRAMKPKAAMLASHFGVSYQHGIGGLVEFWDLCGDPREIERLATSGVVKVVLTADELEARFEMGFGKHLSVVKLASMGLVAKDAEGYRVRGMSRYFEPVMARLQRKAAAVAGGKASAAVRLAAAGTAQPSGSRAVRERFESGSNGSSNGSSNRRRTGVEPAPNTEDRGQRTDTTSLGIGGLRDLMDAIFMSIRGASYHWSSADELAVGALLGQAHGDEEEILRRWALCLEHTFPTWDTVTHLSKNWNACAKAQASGPQTQADADAEHRAKHGVVPGVNAPCRLLNARTK